MSAERIETLVIVPARCGSKGLADKNIRLLAGKPLLQWTVQAALQADIANTQIIVSTDSADYARMAEQFGASAPFLRPARFARDTSSAIDVIEHALAWFEHSRGYLPQYLMWLQPTSPLRSVGSIVEAMRLLTERQADSVIGCKAIERDLTTLFYCGEDSLVPLDDSRPTQTRRQAVEPLLTPNGAMYLAKTALLRERRSFYGTKTVPMLMDSLESMDIDTELDWRIAEACIQQGVRDG